MTTAQRTSQPQPLANPAYGIIFHPTFPPETLPDFARRAEAAGFDEIWLWEDSFWAGGYTSATALLASTHHIRVGVGLFPATVRNPLFSAMEIMTLARLYPGRFMPGFGHGVEGWIKQIGAAPQSSMRALEETVVAIRRLLKGENVTMHGSHVNLEAVQMLITPEVQHLPPLCIGAIREKSLRLAGRVADGTIITELSSPAYVRWARQQIDAGRAEAGADALASNRLVVFVHAKALPDGATARSIARPVIAKRFGWNTASTHLGPLGIAEEAARIYQAGGAEAIASHMPDAWLDELTASGTPEQAVATLHHLAEAGADSIILQPLDGDPACLDEYARYLLPALNKG